MVYSLKLSYCLEKQLRRSGSDVDQVVEHEVEEILDFKNSLYLVKGVRYIITRAVELDEVESVILKISRNISTPSIMVS